MKFFNKYIALGIGMSFLAACNIPKVATNTTDKKIPENYVNADRVDTTSLTIAHIGYDEFFADQHLKTLIQKALKDNWDYKNVLKRVEIANAYMQRARLLNIPSLDFVLNGSGTKFGKYTMEGVGNFDTNLSQNIDDDQRVKTNPTPNYYFGVAASWEADIWGKYKNMKAAARHRYLSTMAGKQVLEAALTTQVALTYYDLVALDQEIEILNNNIALQNKAFEVVQLKQEVGHATLLAVKQMKAQIHNSRAALFMKQQELQEKEQFMQMLIGEYEGSVVRSKTIDINAVKYVYQQAIPTQMMQYRPDIQEALHELEAYKADAHAARAAFFPTVSLTGYGAMNTFNFEKLFNAKSFAWQLFGGLVAPVFNKGQIRTEFKVANLNQEIAFNTFQNKAAGAYREVNLLLKNIYNLNTAYNEKEQELTALKEGVDISQDLYLTGYSTYIELIAAQKSLLDADLQIIDLKRRQVQNFVQLYKALGGGYSL